MAPMVPQLASSCSCNMQRKAILFLILIILSITTFLTVGALQYQHHHGGGCIPVERAALLSFKKGITSDSAKVLASWRGQDCCRWRGVSCSNRTGHVIKLHLGNTILDPDTSFFNPCDNANSLFGEISPSLLSLEHLEYMDLSMNCFLGPNSHVPHFLFSMENLVHLNLSGIPFTGRVPSQLGNLSKLQQLDLGQGYSGIYSTDITWLTKIPLLQYLSMSGINLSRIASWPHTLNMIPSLRVVNLAECSLDTASQSLPHFNLTKLEKLDLSYNNFGHSIASSWFWNATSLKYLSLRANVYANWLFGEIPDAIGNMKSLMVLDLSATNLNKTGNLKNLCSLEILDLSNNYMNGDITVLMEGLPRCAWKQLQELHFHGNEFTGTLPNLIGEFSALSILELDSNNLIGPIPPEIGALTALTYLDMGSNNLTGSLPSDLGKLRNLTTLFLEQNKITGSLPTEIGSLNNLVHLDLGNNNFSGVISEEHFANLKSLKYIDLSSNHLKIEVDSDWRPPFSLESAVFASCQMGPLFPAWLQQLREITRLDISNTTIEDKFPDWFWYTFSKATYLDISKNQISGSLPEHLDGMALEELHLGSNQLTGSIPSLLTNVTMLDISNNNFSEAIPSKFEAPRLQILLINSNRLGGYIPESIGKLQQLLYLDLSNNILEGEIPECFDIQKVQFLLLGKNSLSGNFPVFLRNNTELKFLDLAWNKFSGRLPTWIGELVNLRFVLLSQNAFSDNIPVGITNLTCLQYLDLSSNDFSGAIPWNLLNLTSMIRFQEEPWDMYDGEIGGKIYMGTGHLEKILVVTKGQRLTYGRTLALFVSIDLSHNSLTGEIPTDITSLVALMNMNLSWNQLSGQIPRTIGTMQSLLSLDLSENKLSGEIPSSISNLTSLAALNLSYNVFSGRIPSGRQLDTLDVDNPSLMYIGNSGLCGPPVHKNCSGNDSFIHGYLQSSNKRFEPLTFYFGLILGLLVGLWMVFCALLFNKTWRIAYFQLFDKMYDIVCVFVAVKWARFGKNTSAE